MAHMRIQRKTSKNPNPGVLGNHGPGEAGQILPWPLVPNLRSMPNSASAVVRKKEPHTDHIGE